MPIFEVTSMGRSRRRPASSPKYDPSVWKSLDADFERRKTGRRAMETARRKQLADQARADRIYRLLTLLGEGTPSQPVMHHGELIMPPMVWASILLPLARAWVRYPGLYDHGLVPRLLIRNDESCLAYDVARDIFEFACRGASLEDVAQYVADAVRRLSANRADGFFTSLLDDSGGLATYFGRLAFWFSKTGSDIWGDRGVRGLVVSIMTTPRNGPTPRSDTEPTPDPTLRQAAPPRELAPMQPEAELASLFDACPKALAHTAAGFGPALDWLDFLDVECEQLHLGAERLPDEGDYRTATEIAAHVSRWAGFAPPPQLVARGRVSLAVARDFVSACRQPFMDRSRQQYWVWRHATSGCSGADFFVRWHLDEMRSAWEAVKGAGPEAQRVMNILDAVRTEFAHLHSLWAEPQHFTPDYLPVAAFAIEKANAVLLARRPAPVGPCYFAQLNELIRELREPVQRALPQPSRRRRGRRPHPNPERDAQLLARYRESGVPRKDFARSVGMTDKELRQAIDRARKREPHRRPRKGRRKKPSSG